VGTVADTERLTEEEREMLDRVNGIIPDLYDAVESILTARVSATNLIALNKALAERDAARADLAAANARVAELEAERDEAKAAHEHIIGVCSDLCLYCHGFNRAALDAGTDT
jgi:hypothetical protein